MQHTPTPWREGARGPNNMPVIGARGLMIAHVCTGIDFQTEADANAAFIVKACNSHDALVAALKSARDLLANTDGISKNNIDNLAGEEVKKINAALAAVGENGGAQ